MDQVIEQSVLSFLDLVKDIKLLHQEMRERARLSINSTQTLRNWLIGYYIVEYEQHGSDRAKYGDNLLQRLEKTILTKGINTTLLQLSRLFYLRYPQVAEVVPQICATLSHKSNPAEMKQICATALHKSQQSIRSAAPVELRTPVHELLTRLSFSHIRELLTLDDPTVRYFYEKECIEGMWSVRELRRQIATNLHIRVGVSRNKEKAIAQVNANAEHENLSLQIREPFSFEFLGLQAQEVVTESELEDALISHLQDFLLEMGKGFCFEARQKRIIIDGRYYFPDLVFYNRLLHCNVIVELKNDEFHHEYLGQLNAYVSYYKENEMHDGDSAPVGILLCTHKGEKMVEYALAGLDNQLFVSTYMLELPNKRELEDFLCQFRSNGK